MLAYDAQVLARLGLGEDAADHALRHRQERVGKTRFLVAWMKQKLRLAAFRLKHAISGDHAVTNEMRVEILAHGSRERIERLGFARWALGSAKDFCVAAKLLVKEN